MNLKITIKKVTSSKILKAGSMSIVGTFLVRAVNLLTTPIFSRILSVEEYGDANVFLTYVTVFTILMCLDFYGTIGPGLVRFKGKEDEFISVGVFFTSVYAAIVSIIFNATGFFWCDILSINKLELNILLFYSYAMYVITTKSNEYIYSFQYKKNTVLSLSVALFNLIISVLLIETVCKSNRYEGRIIGAALPTIIIAIGVYIHLIKRGRKLWDNNFLKHYLRGGIPLIPHNLSHLILGNADKIMIQRLISSTANGIYSLVYTLGLMLAALIEAVNNVFTPWMFRILKDGEKCILKKVYSIYMLAFLAIAVMIAAISPEVVKILAPEKYWDGNKFILWIVFSTYLIFLYQLYVNIELYYMKTYLISIGTAIAAVINIVLNICFLKEYGYGFAAISTVCAYAALTFFHMLIVNVGLKCRVINNGHVLICAIAMFLVVLLLQTLLNSWIARWTVALIIGIVISRIVIKIYRNGGITAEKF